MLIMFVAAAEESGDNLVGGRGGAYCGMLNASYSLRHSTNMKETAVLPPWQRIWQRIILITVIHMW